MFDPDYHLESLDEISAYIKENHHLPGIPSTMEVKSKGVSLGAVDAKLLAKVEELTLQMIRLNDRDKRLQGEVSDLKKQIVNANPPARGITH